MSPALRAQVRERAGNRCEYCQLRQEDSPLAALHIEHIVPRIYGGGEDLDNVGVKKRADGSPARWGTFEKNGHCSARAGYRALRKKDLFGRTCSDRPATNGH